ncbi:MULTISPECIES: restriction endonuclease subunit S [Methylobacter]
MSAESNVPAIRFKGFSEKWKHTIIGDVLTEIKRPIELIDEKFYQLVTVKRRNEGVVPRSILKGSEILVKSYFVINAGDFLISKRQVVHGANGIVPKNLHNAVVSNEYLVITDNENITALFWTVLSKRTKMHKIFFISSYGVDIEKLVFDVNDWKKRTFLIPRVIEQNRITDYFQQLDTLIAQHQQKHDKLLNLKKALLEKMFPKQGANVPEIRFKGFRGEWEEKALDCEVNFYSGLTYSPSDVVKEAGTFVLRSSNVKGGQIVDADNVYVNSEVINSENVRVGDIIVVVRNGSRSLIGKHAQVKQEMDNTVIGAFMTGIHAEKSTFINALLDTNQFNKEIEKNLGATINQITTGAFKRMQFWFSNPKEQTKIGDFFKQLDTLLNQHQAQLKKLNNIKQACLEKMFV